MKPAPFFFWCLIGSNLIWLFSEASGQVQPPDQSLVARGIVFHDVDGNGKWGAGDIPLPDVKVSNGVEIVKTDAQGHYELSVDDDTIVFLIKPAGYRTPLSSNQLPKFYYVHKPDGSPQLHFPGVAPTGHLPQSIDFPLYRQAEPETFKLYLFGDPQPRDTKEVDYISHDVVTELIGNDRGAAFGVSLGDLAFDNLDTFEALNQSVALIGIPWYNVIGNHDINYDTQKRKYINETFERVYGPSYYSFDYGKVHFVVMDNIDWLPPNAKNERWHYGAGFGEKQMTFLKNDLAMIPESQMVVLMMHIPIVGVKERNEVYRLIEKRPLCLSISGHTHYHEHLFLGKKEGFHGAKKHHHIINVTVCGGWWSGLKDDRGIPHTTMSDGAPNGYSILTFDGDEYRLDFKAAGRPASEQMRITLPNALRAGKTESTSVWVNVYNGSEKSTVEMAIDDATEWAPLQRVVVPDPYFVHMKQKESKIRPPVIPAMPKPHPSSHLWTGKLAQPLQPGTHLLHVRTTDMHGRTYSGKRIFRVVP